jgi:hypothetical protein
MKHAVSKLVFVFTSLFVGYLLATGAVYFATVVCHKMLSSEFPNDPAAIDRIVHGSGYTFQGLIVFVLIPYVPLAVLVYLQLFRK